MSSKISALPNMTALTGAELLTGVQGGVNSNATPAQIKTYIQPYKCYRANLNQSGTDAPVPIVFENTLGGVPVWTRTSTGNYVMTLAGAFSSLKVLVLTNIFMFQNSDETYSFGAVSDANGIGLQTFDSTKAAVDNWGMNIEILVF